MTAVPALAGDRGARRTRSSPTGFPIGKRFKSAQVVRVCDGNPVHLGHHARADGRWRIYAFADAAAPGDALGPVAFADWLATTPESPLRCTPAGRRRRRRGST